MPLHRYRVTGEKTWKKVFRQESYHENDGFCSYCKSKLSYKQATADHRIALSKNGKTTRENITVSCADCNFAKANITEKQFLSLIKKPPVAGTQMCIMRAWMRRKIALQTIRSCKNIQNMFIPTISEN